MHTLAELRERRKTWVQKDRYRSERTLVVLPCNDGGPTGNYFLGGKGRSLWRQFDFCIREFRDNTVLAAVDNAVAWMPGRDDGLGALQFEWEMTRCMSEFDAGVPTANRFDAAKMKLFVDSLRVTCQRIKRYGFKRVFVTLTPLAYRTAFVAAAQLESLPVVVFSAARGGVGNIAAKLLRCLLVNEEAHPWFAGYDISHLVTHYALKRVPLPRAPEKWSMGDPVQDLHVLDVSGIVSVIQGRRGKYYVDRSDSEQDPELLSAKYQVPEEEDFDVFRI